MFCRAEEEGAGLHVVTCDYALSGVRAQGLRKNRGTCRWLCVLVSGTVDVAAKLRSCSTMGIRCGGLSSIMDASLLILLNHSDLSPAQVMPSDRVRWW